MTQMTGLFHLLSEIVSNQLLSLNNAPLLVSFRRRSVQYQHFLRMLKECKLGELAKMMY